MPRARLTLDDISTTRLEEILAGRRSKVGKLEKQHKALQRKLKAIEEKMLLFGGVAGPARGNGKRGPGRRRAHNEMSLSDAIYAVLSKNGGAMKVGEILDGVEAIGYKSTSPAFRGIVNQALIKDERFKAVNRGLYKAK